MLRLFHSFFSADNEAGKHSREVIEAAIERAVEATDPAIQGLFGYKNSLRPAVRHALDHVSHLGHQLAPPLQLAHLKYDADPRLRAFFLSSRQFQQVLRQDASLQDYLRSNRPGDGRVTALLMMTMTEAEGFGAGRQGDVVLTDVRQVRVSFADFHLHDPAVDIHETRRLLKRRAFDYLLGLALEEMTLAGRQEQELERRQDLLQAKVELLRRGGWGLDPVSGEKRPGLDEVRRHLAEVERKLQQLGGPGSGFKRNLALLVDLLQRAEKYLWVEKYCLLVDDLGLRHQHAGPGVVTLDLDRFNTIRGNQAVVCLLDMPESELRRISEGKD